MDFGEIFDAWEDQRGRKKKKKKKTHLMEQFLEQYLPSQMDYKAKDEAAAAEDKKRQYRQKLREMAPLKELDLHGYTVKEALNVLETFLKTCRSEKLSKVLIIHGKGNHSPKGPVLQKKILQYIQASPLAGEYGFADRTQGGRGALWVILR